MSGVDDARVGPEGHMLHLLNVARNSIMPLHHMSDLNSLLKCRFLLQAVMQLRIGRTFVQTNG